MIHTYQKYKARKTAEEFKPYHLHGSNLLTLLFCMIFTFVCFNIMGDEETWVCEECHQHNWSSGPDMWGDFYCIECGTKK